MEPTDPSRPPPPGAYAGPAMPPTPPPPPGAAVGPQHYPAADPTSVLFTLGDIGVSRTFIYTPNGNAPMRGSQWIVTDTTRTEEKIPTWAIVCAIIFALACLLGLLFLLAKERTTVGYVEVRVHSGTLMHATQIPVSDPSHVAGIRALAAQAQSLAAAA